MEKPTVPPQGEPSELPRRNFLRGAIWAAGALMAAVYAIPGLAYLLAPALQKLQAETWIPLGPVSKVEPGVPTLFRADVRRQTGWIVNEEQLTVYVLTEDGRSYIALSNVCTHLGCRVRWVDSQQEFFCPCHNGIFDKAGQVVSGPPPRPLDQYPVKVEDGQLYIQGG
ncbi:MAG TPA: ubiquinol-cytochrome c reductase iron-sulfur subunit [Anaerolineales bacterium]|nr:ubiquinol-cytochrome c reductase iron-sulfur subunit [Anaerolineales bacterium]